MFLNKDYWKTATPESLKRDIEQGADVNAQNNEGVTVLMRASMYSENSEVIRTLIEQGADVHAREETGKTALIWATWFSKNPEVITTLIEQGADVNARDKGNRTAFDFTELNDNPEIAKTLDKYRNDSLSILIVTRHSALVEWLDARGIKGEVRSHLTLEWSPSWDANGNIGPDECTLVTNGIKEVYGVLPLPLIAELTKLGIRVFAVSLDLPSHLRGKELTIYEMESSEVTVAISEVTVNMKPVELPEPVYIDAGDPENGDFKGYIDSLKKSGWVDHTPDGVEISKYLGPRARGGDVTALDTAMDNGSVVFLRLSQPYHRDTVKGFSAYCFNRGDYKSPK